MSPVQLGYVAGIIDGEGYIGIGRDGHIRLVVGSTDDHLCHALQAFTGVGRPAYYWRCFGSKAFWVLSQVRRSLIVKRRQAEIALISRAVPPRDRREFADEIRALNQGKGLPYADEVAARRMELKKAPTKKGARKK